MTSRELLETSILTSTKNGAIKLFIYSRSASHYYKEGPIQWKGSPRTSSTAYRLFGPDSSYAIKAVVSLSFLAVIIWRPCETNFG